MKDPLEVERQELLSMIEELEEIAADLGVNAGVSADLSDQLKRLRVRVRRAHSIPKLKVLWDVASEILKVVAIQLVKVVLETLTCTRPALVKRRWLDDDWRVHQIPASFGGAHAA